MANTYTKSFSDGSALTEAQLNTGFTTVKPSLANLALATSGSSSFQILRSAGSATAPEWDDVGDILASGTMTAAGANAVLAAVTSVSSTQANLIGNALDSSAAANNILAQVDSVSSTQANLIAEAVTRTTGTSVTSLGVAASSAQASFSTTSSTYVAITNMSVDITTSGRPVFVGLVASSATNQSYWTSIASGTGTGTASAAQIKRDSSVIAIYRHDQNADAGVVSNQAVPPSCVQTIDFPTAGTYTYTVETANVSGTASTSQFQNIKLVAYEL